LNPKPYLYNNKKVQKSQEREWKKWKLEVGGREWGAGDRERGVGKVENGKWKIDCASVVEAIGRRKAGVEAIEGRRPRGGLFRGAVEGGA
jgi:hypothetical protein